MERIESVLSAIAAIGVSVIDSNLVDLYLLRFVEATFIKVGINYKNIMMEKIVE